MVERSTVVVLCMEMLVTLNVAERVAQMPTPTKRQQQFPEE